MALVDSWFYIDNDVFEKLAFSRGDRRCLITLSLPSTSMRGDHVRGGVC